MAFRNQPFTLTATGVGFSSDSRGLLEPFAVPDAIFTLARTHDLDGNTVSGPSRIGPGAVQVVDGVATIAVALTLGDDAPPGLYGVRIERAADGATAWFPEALAVLTAGVATAVDPSVLCATAPGTGLAITGTDLLVVGGVKPKVNLTDGLPPWKIGAFTAELEVTPAGCRRVPFGRADVQLCSTLHATVPANARGKIYDLVVAQPPPASFPPSVLPVLVDSPVQLARFPQVLAAVDAPLELSLFGPYLEPDSPRLHVVRAEPPTLLVDGEPFPFEMSGCAPSGFPGHDLCGGVRIIVPTGFPPGRHTITATSMEGCSATTELPLGGRPVIDRVEPAFTCERDGSSRVWIHGSGFVNARARVGDVEVIAGSDCLLDDPYAECRLVFSGAVLQLPVGTYDLRVVNRTLPPIESTPAQLTVAPGPAWIGWPDVRHVYTGAESHVSYPVGMVTGSVRSAELLPASTGDPLPVVVTPSADEVTITIPAGAPENLWRLALHDDSPCEATQDTWVRTHSDFVLWASAFDEPALYVFRDGGTEATARHLVTGGNPGGAMSYSESAGGPIWYFTGPWSWLGADAGGIRFDLRASGDGSPVSGPGVSMYGPYMMTIERDLEIAPGDTWTSYFVPLDDPTGWTRRDADGATAPATVEDLRAVLAYSGGYRIRGRWTDGASEAAIDNLAIELRH